MSTGLRGAAPTVRQACIARLSDAATSPELGGGSDASLVAHFREALGHILEEFASGRVDRENLPYSVEEVLTPHKAARIHELCSWNISEIPHV